MRSTSLSAYAGVAEGGSSVVGSNTPKLPVPSFDDVIVVAVTSSRPVEFKMAALEEAVPLHAAVVVDSQCL